MVLKWRVGELKELSLAGVVEMGSWPSILFSCLPAHTQPTCVHVFSVFLQNNVFSQRVMWRNEHCCSYQRFPIKRCRVVVRFFRQFLQEFLTNSGMRLLHPKHPSFRPANVDTTNSVHQHTYTHWSRRKYKVKHTTHHSHFVTLIGSLLLFIEKQKSNLFQ